MNPPSTGPSPAYHVSYTRRDALKPGDVFVYLDSPYQDAADRQASGTILYVRGAKPWFTSALPSETRQDQLGYGRPVLVLGRVTPPKRVW